ncbi:MAG: TetR/AcrR family transcriptional regulator [Eubacteriales bacterium]
MKGKTSVKERIINAAWEMFYEKGYDHTTVDDIIALSGTSKGSFYYYFESKDSLLSTLSSILDEKYEELSDKMPEDMHAFDKLMLMNHEVHKFMEHKIDVQLLASLYSTQLTTKSDRHLLDQNRVYYKLLQKIVDEGQLKGELTLDKSVGNICKLYGIYERALVSDWCLCQGSYSLADYSKEYMPIMMEHFNVK